MRRACHLAAGWDAQLAVAVSEKLCVQLIRSFPSLLKSLHGTRIVPVRIGISCADAEIDVLVRTTSNTRVWFGRDVDAQRR